MGKNDLLKSTTKPKKKQTTKKAAAAKSKGKKKTNSKKTTPAKTKASKKAAAQKAPPKKLTQQELILKQFDTWTPEKIFKAEIDQAYLDHFVAPPFVTDKKQQQKIDALLIKKYDVDEIKAAGEKYAAEKAAAEKAAAEKAAAEKAAAEKAAAEKAAAEKAAAEKAAAEKAAAEKAAAEKAAAEKAAADKPLPAQSPKAKEDQSQMNKIVLALAVCLIIVITPILTASISNSFKYYLEPSETSLQIWKGDFAPMGKSLLIELPGVAAPETSKPVYCKSEVLPIAFNYYLTKVDNEVAMPGIPNFETIKSDLQKALCFASSKELRDIAHQRLDEIQYMVLLYKADVVASHHDPDSLTTALSYLNETNRLAITAQQTKLVEQKISDITNLLNGAEAK